MVVECYSKYSNKKSRLWKDWKEVVGTRNIRQLQQTDQHVDRDQSSAICSQTLVVYSKLSDMQLNIRSIQLGIRYMVLDVRSIQLGITCIQLGIICHQAVNISGDTKLYSQMSVFCRMGESESKRFTNVLAVRLGTRCIQDCKTVCQQEKNITGGKCVWNYSSAHPTITMASGGFTSGAFIGKCTTWLLLNR